jgi:hypothetical protein
MAIGQLSRRKQLDVLGAGGEERSSHQRPALSITSVDITAATLERKLRPSSVEISDGGPIIGRRLRRRRARAGVRLREAQMKKIMPAVM